MKHVAVLTLLCAAVACGAPAARTSTLDSIPRAAADSIREQAHGMTIEHVDRETEGGREVFEASWSEGGVRHEVKVDARGELLELEIDVTSDQVPAAVRDTAARELGSTDAAIHYVRLRSGNFEAETTIAGKEHEIEIRPDGTLVPRPTADGDDAHDQPDAHDDHDH